MVILEHAQSIETSTLNPYEPNTQVHQWPAKGQSCLIGNIHTFLSDPSWVVLKQIPDTLSFHP